jgi:ubiquinone/menaquinone biosynthesis C-methylase UbiE
MKLNLGSDTIRLDGFLNVDICPDCKPDIVADVSSMPMIEDGSVEEIYASHILEHLPWNTDALYEWHRILAPGGLITVAIPDFIQGYGLYRAGVWDLRYFTATIYGATVLGYREDFGHKQVFSADMLVERVRPYFPDAKTVSQIPHRPLFPGEGIVQGHKAL